MNFDINSLAFIALAIVAVATYIYNTFANRGSIDITTALEGVEEIGTKFSEISNAAKDFAMAAEQLYSTGQLDKESRLSWALEQLQEAFPNVSTGLLITSIEAGVRWMKIVQSGNKNTSGETSSTATSS